MDLAISDYVVLFPVSYNFIYKLLQIEQSFCCSIKFRKSVLIERMQINNCEWRSTKRHVGTLKCRHLSLDRNNNKTVHLATIFT